MGYKVSIFQKQNIKVFILKLQILLMPVPFEINHGRMGIENKAFLDYC